MRYILIFSLVIFALTAGSISAQPIDPVYEVGMNDCKPYIPEALILAKQGNADVQFYIGNFYRMGTCFPEDGLAAIYWYRQAANQGAGRAQYEMGRMYDLGDGVPQDLTQAFIWYSMAGINGVDRAERKRKLVQAEMDETQLSVAMKKTVDCLHSNYQNCE